MQKPTIPENDVARIEILKHYGVLDTLPEKSFDDLTELAAEICESPIALISLIDENRQWFKSKIGMTVEETSRDISFCGHAIHHTDLFIVPDAVNDDRFADNPLVTGDPKIRFYAGAPLISSDGYALGTLCVIDRVPRQMKEAHQRALRVLSKHVMTQLELRRKNIELRNIHTERDEIKERVRTLEETDRSRLALIRVLEDRRRADAAQRESEIRYRSIFENVRDAIYTISPDGKLSSINPAFETLTGWTVEEWIDKPFANLVHQEDLPKAIEIFQKVMSGKKVEPYELRIKIKSGEYKIGKFTPSPLIIDGKIVAVLGIARDITEQKREEESIRQGEQQLKLYIDNAGDAIYVIDKATGQILKCNTRACHDLGYSMDELLKLSTIDIEAILPYGEVTEIHRKLKPGEVQTIIGTHRRKDGTIFPVEIRLSSLAPAQPELMIAMVRNITERKSAEEEIIKHSKELRALLKSSQSIAGTLNLETILQTSTDSIIELMELKSAAIYLLKGEMLHLGATSPELPPGFPVEFRGAMLVDHPHIQKAITTSQPVIIQDSTITDLTPAERAICEQRNLRSILYLPLVAKTNVIGVLIVASIEKPKLFKQSEIESCLTLANLTALAVENSRLYENSQNEIKERIHAENELLKSEIKFRNVFEKSVDAIGVSKLGIHEFVNSAYLTLFGYGDSKELARKPIIDLIAPSERKKILDLVQLRSKGELVPSTYETRGLRKDGSEFDMDVHVSSYDLNEETYTLVILRNITERKHFENALQRSEERYRLIFKNSPLPMWVYDFDTLQFLMVNQAAQMHYGYSEAEFLSMTLRDIRPPEDIVEFENLLRHITPGLTHSGEWRHRKKSGMVIQVSIHSHEIIFNGRKARLVLAEDITERKQVEEALRISEEKFTKVFRSSPDIIVLTSLADGRLVDVNDRLQDATGYKPEEIIGKRTDELQFWANPDERKRYTDLLQKNGRVRDLEVGFRIKSGEIRDTLLSGEIIELHDGQYILGVIRDITERKQAEIAVNESEANLSSLINNRNESIWSIDKNYNYIKFNNFFAEAYFIRFNIKIQKGMNSLDILTPELRAYWKEHYDSALSGEQDIFEFSAHLHNELHYYQVFLNPIILNEKITGVSALSIDITERRRAEKSLRENEALLRTIAENYPNSYLSIIEKDLTVGFTSGQEFKKLNLDPEQFVGMTLDQVYGDQTPVVLEHYLKTFAGEERLFELFINNQNQLYRTVPLYAQDGTIPRILSVVENITERKQAVEEKLSLSNMLQTSLNELYIFDSKTLKFKFVNLGALKNLGYTSEEIIHLTPLDLKPEFNESSFRTKISPLARKEIPKLIFETKHKRKNGSVYDVEVHLHLTQYMLKEAYVAFILDITDRKRAEEALRESENKYRKLYESMTDAFVEVDMQGRIKEFNKSYIEMLGYTDEEIRNLTYIELTPQKWHEFETKIIEEEIMPRGYSGVYEKEYRRKDNTILPVELRTFLMRDEVGNPSSMWAIVRDISERKRTMEEINRRANELAALNSLSQRVNQSLILDDVINYVVEETFKATQSDIVFLFFRENEKLILHRIEPKNYKDQFKDFPEHRVGECICGLAVSQRKSIYSSDIFTDERCTWEECKKAGLRSFAALPLQNGKEIFGVIGLAARKERDFGSQAGFLETLAGQVSSGFLNARMYQAIEIQRDELSNSREQMRQLAIRLQSIREEESTRIAREIHDELGQTLTAMKIDIKWLEKQIPMEQKPSHNKIESILNLLDSTIQTVRKISTELRPGVLELGLLPAIRWQIKEFQTRTGTQCNFSENVADISFSEEQSINLFRMFQEILTNIIRHANATSVSINLSRDEKNFIMIVQDNGKGITKEEVHNTKSLGILGMHERATIIRGDLDIHNIQGEGTKIVVKVPINKEMN
ncbi:MAG: PAS domain S-box protein [Ignavibacteriales bacterium]|nr:PAS domain S-box protein [Ignavibacteriales bacterium]